ncbi:MAG: S-adenosylmethionine:tRNA ribosyltransferase-isomerase [Ignavibacteriae bacterium]|nr:S-adenosylmethionine:tRNA ribosyltransferase-isomerase [Ignavibacteriota bacterium]
MQSYIPTLELSEFIYDLLPERIAFTPLPNRDISKLLVAHTDSGNIEHRIFCELPSLLPDNSLIVVNTTRVIAARLLLSKESGGAVEVFCLSPENNLPPAIALMSHSPCRWKCLVRGKNLKDGTVLKANLGESIDSELTAIIIKRIYSEAIVEFHWSSDIIFGDILEQFGKIPLPPYIKRDTTPEDAIRYQTVYAANEGSVAAPTAGLHFTPEVFEELEAKDIKRIEVNLAVGLGTFKPLETETLSEFTMHGELISVNRDVIEQLLSWLDKSDRGRFVCVGTTSVRTIESLYWFGVRLSINDEDCKNQPTFSLGQWDAFRLARKAISPQKSLRTIQEWMNVHSLEAVEGITEILIVPSYQFRLCNALVTNFHQPHSTLILLVAAFVGKEMWRKIYDEALGNGYRFLSYGDSSLLLQGSL